MNAPRVRKHASGLRVQEVTGPAIPRAHLSNTVDLPQVCPVSGNPRAGSTLVFTYRPQGWCLEVYSVVQLVDRFRGGFKGRGRYPAERNMEGMIHLLAQMAADALGVPVNARADLVLDAGRMRVRAKATPCVST